MAVTLDDDRRAQVVKKLQGFFLQEFEEDLSAFRADSMLDFVLESMGPSIYNQGVEDARIYMARRLDELDIEVHEVEAG